MAQNSYRYVFASSTSQLPSTGTTVNLGVGQVGIFDANSWQAVTAPTVQVNNAILFAQGTPADTFPQGVAKGNQTYKTQALTPFQITKWKAHKAQPGKSQVVTLGYDGVDATKNLNVPTGATNFTFWVTLSGQPIANLLGDTPETHYASYTEQFSVNLPCDNTCADGCGTTIDPNIIADAVISSFQTRKIIGGQFYTDYVKVSKLINCQTPSGLPTVGYTTYQLTLQDTGDNIALSQVQAQYTGNTITRLFYNGITSVYQVVLPTSGSAPANYNNTVNPVIPNCTTCPSGYTYNAITYLWVVKRAGDPASVLTSIKSNYADSNAILLSFDGAIGTYEIHKTTSATITPYADTDIVYNAGSLQNTCTINSNITTPWTNVGTCTKAQKTYQLTIKNTDCGGTYLTQLQAIYGSGVALVSSNTGTCTSLYNLTITSDNVACDTCDNQPYSFTAPVPFLGLKWVEVAGQTGYGTNCSVGVKFESIYEQRKWQECFLYSTPYEFEPLFITLSTRNPDPNDYSVLCYPNVPTTIVSPVQYEYGLGRVVANGVIESNYQFNQPWRRNPAERDSFAYQLGINLQGYYDEYVLEATYTPSEAQSMSGFGHSPIQKYEYHFFFPQGEGVAFATAINGYLASANSPLSPVNI
jgi:hypothetical protein